MASPAAERLNKMKNSLGGIHDAIQADVNKRKEGESSKVAEVRHLAEKVEKHLNLEVKRRTDADKTLQHMFETRLKDIAENIEKAYAAKLDGIQMSVDVLTKKVVSLEKELVSERERTAKLASELRHASTNSVADVKAALEQEKTGRLEKEAQILKKIAEDTQRTNERVEIEKNQRIEHVDTVKEELTKQMKSDQRVAEKFRSKTLDDLDCLKTAIKVEAQARESGEENIANSMDIMVTQLHEGLKIVSK